MRLTPTTIFGRGKPHGGGREHPIRFGAFGGAFTLLEVLIACTIFFLVAFSVLELVTRSLGMARALQYKTVDATILAAELSLTNKLEEGTESGDFGDLYPDYTWTRQIYEVGSNGLFRVDFLVHQEKAKRGESESTMSILMWRPESQSRFGAFGGNR